jgi:hypothetical protein
VCSEYIHCRSLHRWGDHNGHPSESGRCFSLWGLLTFGARVLGTILGGSNLHCTVSHVEKTHRNCFASDNNNTLQGHEKDMAGICRLAAAIISKSIARLPMREAAQRRCAVAKPGIEVIPCDLRGMRIREIQRQRSVCLTNKTSSFLHRSNRAVVRD